MTELFSTYFGGILFRQVTTGSGPDQGGGGGGGGGRDRNTARTDDRRKKNIYIYPIAKGPSRLKGPWANAQVAHMVDPGLVTTNE